MKFNIPEIKNALNNMQENATPEWRNKLKGNDFEGIDDFSAGVAKESSDRSGLSDLQRGIVEIASKKAANVVIQKTGEQVVVHQTTKALAEKLGEHVAKNIATQIPREIIRESAGHVTSAAFKKGAFKVSEEVTEKLAGAIFENGVKATVEGVTEEVAKNAAETALTNSAKNMVDLIPVVGALISVGIDVGILAHQRHSAKSAVKDMLSADDFAQASKGNAILEQEFSQENSSFMKQLGMNAVGAIAGLTGVGQFITAGISVGIGVMDGVERNGNAFHKIKNLSEREGNTVSPEEVLSVIASTYEKKATGKVINAMLEGSDVADFSKADKRLAAVSQELAKVYAAEINDPNSKASVGDLITMVGDKNFYSKQVSKMAKAKDGQEVNVAEQVREEIRAKYDQQPSAAQVGHGR